VIYKITSNVQQAPVPQIRLRCPACGDRALLETLHNDWGAPREAGAGHLAWGARRCPNPDCGALILILRKGDGTLLESYPAQTLDFDATNLPDAVRQALEEAVRCHAQQCYMAAAIMVRKTLEQVCANRGAEGKSLYDRIEALGSKVILPAGMLGGLHDLRMLGNDAAHVKAKVYDDIGQDEVEAAIEVTKEILKATYQYEDIMGRLAALKKPKAT
jgi:uncharacterized protein DUF4145